MFIKIYSIYDFISIFALLVNIYFLFSFDVVLITGLLTCLFFHDFTKELTIGWYAPIFKRPNGAINCSLFNSGGLAEHKSGFPSGHVTVISLFMNILRLRSGLKNDWKTVIIYNFPIVLMGYARIMKGCHNFIQVVAGYLLGYCVANVIFMYEDTIHKIFNKFRNSFNHYVYYVKEE